MSRELVLHNRQLARSINLRLLRDIGLELLRLLEVDQFELGVILVGAAEMTKLNRDFLQHHGATDVITFDYGFGVPGGLVLQKPAPGKPPAPNRLPAELRTLHGDVFICLDQAASQASSFRTTWQSELVRYLVHGLLHLSGYDDLQPAARRAMKLEENRLLRQLSKRFCFADLAKCDPRQRRLTRKSQIQNREFPPLRFALRNPLRKTTLAG